MNEMVVQARRTAQTERVRHFKQGLRLAAEYPSS
jgi:hypothetical protein